MLTIGRRQALDSNHSLRLPGPSSAGTRPRHASASKARTETSLTGHAGHSAYITCLCDGRRRRGASLQMGGMVHRLEERHEGAGLLRRRAGAGGPAGLGGHAGLRCRRQARRQLHPDDGRLGRQPVGHGGADPGDARLADVHDALALGRRRGRRHAVRADVVASVAAARWLCWAWVCWAVCRPLSAGSWSHQASSRA